MTTIQKVTAFALVEQQQRWAQQLRTVEQELADLLELPAYSRDRERLANLCLARDLAVQSHWYWSRGVLKWMHAPVEA